MSTKNRFRIGLLVVVIVLSLVGVMVGVPASSSGLVLPLVLRSWPTSFARYESPLISEVLYNPIGEEPEGEWFEIYNPAEFPISLEQYKIGDAEMVGDHEGMYIFPQDTTINPGEVIVVANSAVIFFSVYGDYPDFELSDSQGSVPDMIKYYVWASGSTNLSNLGDELILMGSIDETEDSVSWGRSTFALDPSVPSVQDGHSIERWPASWDRDTAEDWIDQSQPQPGIVNTSTPTPEPTSTPTVTLTPTKSKIPCGSIDLLISEVLFDPDQIPDSDGEWFELVNVGDQYVNLSCVHVGDEETYLGGEGMLGFPDEVVLSPGGVLVIANRAIDFLATYDFYPDFEINSSLSIVPDMLMYSDYANGNVDLNNDGDEVLILDGTLNLIDAVSWGNSNYAFSPSVDKVSSGFSIERKPAYIDTDSATDWNEQENPDPGNVDNTLPTLITPSPSITLSLTPSPSPSRSPTPTSTPSPTSTPTSTNTPDETPGEIGILISEVMYNPQSQEPYGEWVEIWNAGVVAADLSSYKLGDEETYGGVEGMYWFPAGSSIEPGQIVIVANRATAFKLVYDFYPDYEFNDSRLEVPDMIPSEEWSGGEFRLDNTGDEVFILNEVDAIIDVVAFGQSEYLGFYPPMILVAEGHSIERYPANVDTDSNADWIDQADPNPGIIFVTSLLY